MKYKLNNKDKYGRKKQTFLNKRPEHTLKYDDFGTPYLEKTGEFDIKEAIQSAKGPSIQEIVQTSQILGEAPEGLGDGYYGDRTAFKTEFDDAKRAVDEAEAKLKAEYNNWKGKDNMAYNNFKRALKDGDYEALRKATITKEKKNGE